MKKLLAKLLVLLLLLNLGSGALPSVSHATLLQVDSSLKFDLEPYVAQQGTDYIAAQFKVSRGCTLYYQAVPSGTAVTNESIISGYLYKDFMFGATSYVIFDDLQPGTSYDLCFVLVDYEGYKIAGNTPFKLLNQETAALDTTTGNGIQSATYANSSTPGYPKGDGAHIYLALEAPNFSPIPVYTDPNDLQIVFPSSSVGASGPRTLSETEYSIEPMVKGARMMNVWIKPETFTTGTLSNYLVTTPGALEITIIDQNVPNPVVTHDGNVALTVHSEVLDAETLPVMYPKCYVENAEADYILIELDRNVPISSLPTLSEFTVTAQGLPSNPVSSVVPIETTTGYAKSFKLVFDATAKTYIRSQSNLPFTVTYDAQSQLFIMVNDAFNPYFIKYDSAASDSNNEITSIKFFDGTDYEMTATRQTDSMDFTLKVPYVGLELANFKKFLSAAKITPASPQACIDTMMDGGMFISVKALNGDLAQYLLSFQSDSLTLGGLTFGGTPVSSFTPYQNPGTPYVINTSTLYTTTTLPSLAAIYDTVAGTQCTISAPTALSGTGNFEYTITLSDGLTTPTTKTYHVRVLYSTTTTPTTDKDKTTGSASTTTSSTPSTPSTGDPTQPYDPFKTLGDVKPSPEQITQEINRLTTLINPEQPGNMATLSNNFDTIFKAVTNSEQAYQTLGAMGDVLSKLQLNSPDPVANASMAKLAEQLTSSTESKLLLISSPKQQLEVLSGFVNAAKPLQASSAVPLTEMNQSVGEMLQKTAINFGTGEVEATATGEPIVVKNDLVEELIKDQAEALKALNDLQSKFFESGSQQPLKPEIRLEVKGSSETKPVAVALQRETLELLKTQKVENFTIKEAVAEVRVPVSDLKSDGPMEIRIQQRPAPTLSQPLPEPPKVTYEFSMSFNNQPQDTFSKPITLSFELSAFGYSGSTGGGLSVGRFNEALNVWEPVGGILDPQSGTIFVKRTHLSQYTVLKTKKSFADADNSWAKEEINAMLNKGIVSDTAKFEPKSLLTRGEFAQWIANAYGLKVSDQSMPFKDVPKNSEYYSAIAAVYQQGILQGSKGKFNPDKPLTQNELAAALGKVLVSFDNKQKSDKVTSKYLSKLKTTQVASWAEDDMALLMELGMAVDAKSGASNITKEAAASAFMKFYRS